MQQRTRQLNSAKQKRGPVVYWMSRDQRVDDNWAFLAAQMSAIQTGSSLSVVFVLDPNYPGATYRHYHFMTVGLKETEEACMRYNVPFILLYGYPPVEVASYAKSVSAGAVYTDFDPLKIKRAWKDSLAALLDVSLLEVDTHNIVPAWIVSGKSEYSAATFRRKYQEHIDTFLTDIPRPARMNTNVEHVPVDWEKALLRIPHHNGVKLTADIAPGQRAGTATLNRFLSEGLEHYDRYRNDPVRNATSGLSPWLHFGQISPQRVALKLMQSDAPDEARAAFFDQMVTRRELSDNFCLYNPHYDTPDGYHEWAIRTLDAHLPDERDYVYTRKQFEEARTHDKLWNAAQRELVRTGKMHAYMRMYWAKKILEWTSRYTEAHATAVYLNDTYSLDGRDPNGYAGIAWAIGGVHDRPWFERPVYGKIRYMNENGCRRKFDVDEYIRRNAERL
ncbi:MAG: deoxyribodipyrimidine photo-lyase [Spirochaetota bacterium]